MTDEQKAELRKTADARGASVLPGSTGGKEIRDLLGIPGTIVTLKVVDKDAGKIQITAKRKAFQIVLDKEAMLPGIFALGGGNGSMNTFEEEQKLHGMTPVNPWDIKA